MRCKLTLLIALLMCGVGFVPTALATETEPPPTQNVPVATGTATFTPTFLLNSRLSEPTTITTELKMEGSEYFGYSDPVAGITLHLPAGTGISSAGFPTCERAHLEEKGLVGCPPGSLDGPRSESTFEVSFGDEDVEEITKVQAVFGPPGVRYFYVYGESPVRLEFTMEAHIENDSPPYGQKLVIELPLIETVPGAPNSSIDDLRLAMGVSREEHGVNLSSLTMPSECPTGKFAWGVDVMFYGQASKPMGTAQTVCPTAGTREGSQTTLSASNLTPLLGEATTYTATIKPASEYVAEPTGTVTFLDYTTPIEGCTALPLTAGQPTTASCKVTYASAGFHGITAVYSGDPDYLGSASTETVVHAAGTEAGTEKVAPKEAPKEEVKTTLPPVGPPNTGDGEPLKPVVTVTCTVPKLKGKSLAQAKKLLSKAHCGIGKVTKKGHAKKAVVVSQKPGVGKSLPSGAKVTVKVN